ncbi:hypothetical protein ACJ72_08842, partial [Emergomyces africanus]
MTKVNLKNRNTLDFNKIYRTAYEIQINIENTTRLTILEEVMIACQKNDEMIQKLIDKLMNSALFQASSLHSSS